MIAQNYGRIVNIASIAGKEGNPNAAHYSASKAGVIALTKSLGKELAGYDIAVNAVTPAAAKTAIFDQLKQEHIDFMLSKIPRNRFVTVQEVAGLVAWMASRRIPSRRVPCSTSPAAGRRIDRRGGGRRCRLGQAQRRPNTSRGLRPCWVIAPARPNLP